MGHGTARGIAGLAAFVAAIGMAEAVAAPSAAEIVSIEGKGEYRPETQSSWSAARPRQAVSGGTYLRTLDLSRMAILFADGVQKQLFPNSSIQVKQVGGPDQPTVINMQRGKSWTQSKTAPRGLTMETPSAVAAIRGTDWEMEVDDEGRATLSVFSGEVELANDHGRIVVAANEQGRAEKGKAPVKLTLVVSRDRIQWVSSFSIDPSRHPGEELPQAYARLGRAADRTAEGELLLADIEIFRGDFAAARAALERGARRFPADERFEVGLARVALLSGEAGEARRHAQAAVARRPSVAAHGILGEVERRDGNAAAALAAYGEAIRAGAKDPRGWHGVGVVEAERENVGRARSNLAQAIALDASHADALGELGTLEGVAGNLAAGREALGRALAQQPDNYVALTGLGMLELRAGRLEAALDALLRATLVEPRYSRAHLYLAAAYYQMRRDKPALEELDRAAQTDPRDPLPHLLRGIVHLDRLEPVPAAQAAQRALELLPYVKSLNPVADNQKGIANVGYPLAFLGLEAWARSAAHDSYSPFWGASHLFLADRYPGEFNRRSELSQGFLTNPLAFGASNRFQALLPEPGRFGTVSLRALRSDDVDSIEPVATLNGSYAAPVPVAYFLEGIHTTIEPRNSDLRMRGPTFTFALGAKPTHELGLFLYLTRLSLDADLGRPDETGTFDRVEATNTRVEGGLRYAFAADNSLWAKVGASRQDASAAEKTQLVLPSLTLVQAQDFTLEPEAADGALRHTFAIDPRLQATWGLEAARVRSPRALERDATFHFPQDKVPRDRVDQTDVDRSAVAYALGRWGDDRLALEAGGAWTRYEKTRDILVTVASGPITAFERYERSRFDPLAGITWRPDPALTVRGACRRWARPASLDTLMPVAVAGMPLDDQLVYAGGTLEQCRAAAEWTPGTRLFAAARVESSEAENLVSPLDGVLNTQQDVTNLDRLRNRALTQEAKPDQLEDAPVFGAGRARRASVAVDYIAGRSVALRAYYTYTDSENTRAGFEGRAIPYLPRHQANLGLSWSPGWRTYVRLNAAWRSQRYVDEANTAWLRPGWDAAVDVFVESEDKRWSVELLGLNLLKKDASDVFGVLVNYRF